MKAIHYDLRKMKRVDNFPLEGGLTIRQDAPHRYRLLTNYSGELNQLDVNTTNFGVAFRFAYSDNSNTEEVLALLKDIDAHIAVAMTPEAHRLHEMLLEFSNISDSIFYAKEEYGANLDPDVYYYVAKIYSTLFPIFGGQHDHHNGWPIINDNFYSFNSYLPIVGSWDGAPTWRDLLLELFGVYRRDLLKAVERLHPSIIVYLSWLTEIMPIEKIIEIAYSEGMEGKQVEPYEIHHFCRINDEHMATIERLPLKVRVRLMGSLVSLGIDDNGDMANLAIDTLVMLKRVPLDAMKRFKSDKTWVEVHNRALELSEDEVHNEKAPTVYPPVTFPQELEALDETIFTMDNQEFALRLLREKESFTFVGNTMNICIGKAGYYSKAINGTSYSFIMENKDFLAAAEVQKRDGHWCVNEIKGRNNSVPPCLPLLQKIILELLGEEVIYGKTASKLTVHEGLPQEEIELFETDLTPIRMDLNEIRDTRAIIENIEQLELSDTLTSRMVRRAIEISTNTHKLTPDILKAAQRMKCSYEREVTRLELEPLDVDAEIKARFPHLFRDDFRVDI